MRFSSQVRLQRLALTLLDYPLLLLPGLPLPPALLRYPATPLGLLRLLLAQHLPLALTVLLPLELMLVLEPALLLVLLLVLGMAAMILRLESVQSQ